MTERRFTNSELATFRRCRRKWKLTYVDHLGLARDEGEVSTAKTGTLVHIGLDAWYGAPEGERSAAVALAVVRGRIDDDVAALTERQELGKIAKVEKQGKLALTMLEGYFEWLEETGADVGLEIVSSEESVDLPVPGFPGVRLLGKLDVRIRREQDGAIMFLDHKTVQSIDTYVEGLYRATQFRHYHLLEYLKWLEDVEAGALPPDTEHRGTDGVIVNMLRRVGRGPRATPPFYGREEVRHNIHVLRAYWQQVMGEIARILETEQALAAGGDHQQLTPPNPTRDCAWDCIFRPICPMFDDGGDVRSVIQLSYRETDPLARYADETDSDGDE